MYSERMKFKNLFLLILGTFLWAGCPPGGSRKTVCTGNKCEEVPEKETLQPFLQCRITDGSSARLKGVPVWGELKFEAPELGNKAKAEQLASVAQVNANSESSFKEGCHCVQGNTPCQWTCSIYVKNPGRDVRCPWPRSCDLKQVGVTIVTWSYWEKTIPLIHYQDVLASTMERVSLLYLSLVPKRKFTPSP